MRPRPRRSSALFSAILALGACSRARQAPDASPAAEGASSQASASPASSPSPTPHAPAPKAAPRPEGPLLGVIAYEAPVFEKPSRQAKKLGSLRVGALVTRKAEPAGRDGCPGGFYGIAPRGFVCVGDEATLDENHPLLRAASARPDRSKPLPYRYGFVRAVAPMYLHIPTKAEQEQSEFGLEKHLLWWTNEGLAANRSGNGANDLPVDDRGSVTTTTPPGVRPSSELSQGELFGGTSDKDEPPFWLKGGRQIPNISAFKVPPYAIFAGRVRRHTGLAFIGSFPTGPESLERRFAVTTDLRLVPSSKVKPDAASDFHGVELSPERPLPFCFVRKKDAHVYRMEDDKPHKTSEPLKRRSLLSVTGKSVRLHDIPYRELIAGKWLSGNDVGCVVEPTEWPEAAKTGEKWVEISIENQTLVLWQGKKAQYATLVSTGQDGMGDPKTTKSTIRGVFRIRTKHITSTMDSNEKAPERSVEEGQKVRRGQGLFELRDVPWIQYFEGGFALHTAYWHDVFGTARSHGCVNLSPIDGLRVFHFTEPKIPDGWHSVVAGGELGPGTTVVVHK